MEKIAENLWVLRFALSLLGTRIGRTVTVVRLRSGELVTHSTAPFTAGDVSAIKALGRPAWLVDATLFHDTFAEHGRAAFPSIPYLVPEGFAACSDRIRPLHAPPSAWVGELEVLRLEGAPKVREHLFFHRPSRTLIVADLLFNLPADSAWWTRFFFRWFAGLKQLSGMSLMFRLLIRDRAAFGESIRQMMQWDFDRIIVAHGEIVESNAKATFTKALAARGF